MHNIFLNHIQIYNIKYIISSSTSSNHIQTYIITLPFFLSNWYKTKCIKYATYPLSKSDKYIKYTIYLLITPCHNSSLYYSITKSNASNTHHIFLHIFKSHTILQQFFPSFYCSPNVSSTQHIFFHIFKSHSLLFLLFAQNQIRIKYIHVRITFETYINIIIIPLLHFRHIRTQKQCVQNNVYDRYSFHLRISNSSLQVSTSTGRRWPIRQRLDRRRRVIHALLPWPAASYKFPGKFSRNMVLSPVRKHGRVFITVNGRIHYALTTWN